MRKISEFAVPSKETLAKVAAIKESGAKHMVDNADSDSDDEGEEEKQQLFKSALKDYYLALASSEQVADGNMLRL